jgi:hypothetical protein
VTQEASKSMAAPARPRTRRYLAAGVLVAVLVAGWFAWDWWTHPTQFGPSGSMLGQTQDASDLRPLHIAVTLPSQSDERQDLTVKEVEANVAADTAGTQVTFTICTTGPGLDVFLSARGSLDVFC